MKNDRPDVIEILEENKKWHQDQIYRISIAISALKGEKNSIKPEIQKISTRSGVQWAFEIDKLYEKYPTEAFNVKEVCTKLAEQGVAEALDSANQNTVNTALARKVSQGKLVREKPGYYKKKPIRDSQFTEEVK